MTVDEIIRYFPNTKSEIRLYLLLFNPNEGEPYPSGALRRYFAMGGSVMGVALEGERKSMYFLENT